MSQNTSDQFFKDAVLGHPGLFVLFSRKCGTIFLLRNACIISSVLTSSLAKGGGHGVSKMPWLYGTYTMSVYFTPVIGGFS
jgi:POT family proton-dependent oligopeptide transporter